MMRTAGWKLYVIPLVVVGLLLMPLFFVPDYHGPVYPIRIDGVFDDWTGVPRVVGSGALVNANVDITQAAVTDNLDFLSFYMQVRGRALEGDPSASRTMDAYFVFIDTDRSASTGYQVQGLGADRLIEIDGWGGVIAGATLQEFDANRNQRDWGGWFKATPVQAAASGGGIEFQANWESIVQPKATIEVAFGARSWDGTMDMADFTATNARPFLLVRQQTAAPQLATGSQTDIASFDFQAVRGEARITSLNVTLVGSFGPSTFSAIALTDASGVTISRVPTSGTEARFASLSVPVPPGTTVTLRVRPEIAAADGTTVGAVILSPRDVGVASGGISLHLPSAVPASLAYVGTIPSGLRVDGGFADWPTPSIDPVGDVRPRSSPDLDLSAYAFKGASGSAFFMARTVGRVLNGTLIPVSNRAYTGNATSSADSDRDGVPDSVDPMPYDFNNDGIPDVSTNGDYDGDGVKDYGFPGGTDYWLNTTIPANFPAPYAGRKVSVYIGPVERPVALGLDVARFYLDQDGSPATGYSIGGIGADYLVEVEGKEGAIAGVRASRFNGTYPGQWAWAPIGPASAAKDRSEIEVGVAGITITNASLAYLSLSGWAGSSDETAPSPPAPSPPQFVAMRASPSSGNTAPASPAPGGVHALDISGNQKWFFRSTTASGPTGCTNNLDASTTAGAAATSTTLTGTQSGCWYTPAQTPATTASGAWEIIMDLTRVDPTLGFLPNAAGSYGAWATVGSAHSCATAAAYACVNDDPNDGDATYIQTQTDLAKSTFNTLDWASPPSPLNITNVRASVWCKDTQSPVGSVRTLVKNGTNEALGTVTACTGAYAEIFTDYANYPLGASRAWTAIDINNLEIGVSASLTGGNGNPFVSEVKLTVTYTPVYSVEIDLCTSPCTSVDSVLYGPTNFAKFGLDTTITTGTIGAQTLGSSQRIRFKVALVSGTSIAIAYNGPNPGASDSRATVPIPEFADIGFPVVATLLLVLVVRKRRERKRSYHGPTLPT
jgi:hypothetical protein